MSSNITQPDYSDIHKRLTQLAIVLEQRGEDAKVILEAQDAIEDLAAENAEIKRRISDLAEFCKDD